MAIKKRKGSRRIRSIGGRRRKQVKGAPIRGSVAAPAGSSSGTGGYGEESAAVNMDAEPGRSYPEVRGEREFGAEPELETREGPFGEGMPPRASPEGGYAEHRGQSDAI